jgi:hypothetical protein
MDEVAFFRSEESALPDTELDAAVSPSLNRTPGSLKVLISSVHKRSGLLYSKARDFYGKPDPNTLVVMGTTLQFNPSYDAASIERDLERDPERYGAEYLCKWRDDLSSFIPHDLLTAATDNGVLFRHPTKATYTAACDAAGGRGSDSFTAAIAHKEPDGQVVLDRLFERKAPFDAASVIAEIAALLREYGINTITGDRFAGGFPYVDGPLLARLFWQCSDQIACVHMFGLFSRSHMNAGQDGFRDASSKHPSDLWRPVESTECLASWIDRSHHLLVALQVLASAQHGCS